MGIEIVPAAGAFSEQFASRKQWKLDDGLLRAILKVIPKDFTCVDLGAGVGRYVTELRSRGYTIKGFDGIHNIAHLSDGLVQRADLSKPCKLGIVDCVISTEVGEHIPERYEFNYLDNVASHASEMIFMSWATVGQRGRDHVNCHMPEWVAIELVRRDLDWKLNEQKTLAAREVAGKGWDRKLLVFTR